MTCWHPPKSFLARRRTQQVLLQRLHRGFLNTAACGGKSTRAVSTSTWMPPRGGPCGWPNIQCTSFVWVRQPGRFGHSCEGSASGVLNRMLAGSLEPLLASRIFPHYLYFPSALNSANDPTQNLEVRSPSACAPAWWDELVDGRPGAFDAWMERLSPANEGRAALAHVRAPPLALQIKPRWPMQLPLVLRGPSAMPPITVGSTVRSASR